MNTSGNWAGGLGQHSLEASDFYRVERQSGKLAEMINFRLKCGTQRAFSVVAFDELCFKLEVGITLHGRMATITIKGRNLAALYHDLANRKVKEVREFSDKELSETHCFIQAITIHSDYDGS